MNLKKIDHFGNILVEIFHRIALFAIGAATVYAAGVTFIALFQKQHASIQDLLLLFIYLEIGAMVGIYFQTNHMPVRFLIYICITSITRHMVEISTNTGDHTREILIMGLTILVLALAIFTIRYASKHFSNAKDSDNIS